MTAALSHLKILDLSMNLPGPYMTWIAALLGAEVVKVENPDGGDYGRNLGATGDSSPFFEALNRNKKSIALNLKRPEAAGLFLDLIAHYDIVVEGFRPGTMDRLGLGYDALSAKNPRVIFVSISGYGQTGPYRLRAGHDINFTALSGVLGMTGNQSGPAIPGVQIADFVGGSMMGLGAMLAAVIQRDKTGRGQFVDVSMFDGALAAATMVFANVAGGLETPGPGRMFLNGLFPCYNVYETSDGKHMVLGAIEAKFWREFCLAVNRPDLVEGHYGDQRIVAEVRKIFAGRTREEWTALFREHDACCEPLLGLDEAADSELTRARDMIVQDAQGRRFLGCPLKLSDTVIPEMTPAPGLGRDTREVLAGKLGLSTETIDSLVKDGAIRG